MITSTEPILSVALVVGNQRERSARALQSVLEQDIIDQMEVLVMDCSVSGTPPLAGSDHPSVQIVRLAPDVPTGRTRAEGVRQARAPIVAFLEEHCIALAGWAEALVSAFDGPWAAVCGEFHNGNARVGISDAAALANHASFMAPADRRESELLAGHNSTYKREVLLEYGERLETLIRSETVLHWKLGEDGHRLFVEPDVKIVHYSETTLSSHLAGLYAWNRCFGHTRAEVFSWPVWKRALYVFSIPLSPWARLARLFVLIVKRYPGQLGSFFRSFPTMLIGQTYFAIGRAVGVLFGIGNAEPRIMDLELNERRPEKASQDD